MNVEKINEAGRAIKSIVYISVLMFCFLIIGLIIVFNSKDINIIKSTYIGTGLVFLILNLLILIRIYEAGDNLENVKTNQQDIEPVELSDINLEAINPIQDKKDKGIVGIVLFLIIIIFIIVSVYSNSK
jgi:hypothetical protein